MRFIRCRENGIVFQIRSGEEIVEGEIQSDVGECGDIMQPDGTFLTPEVPGPPLVDQTTLGELKDNQLILMDAIATLFETVIGGV